MTPHEHAHEPPHWNGGEHLHGPLPPSQPSNDAPALRPPLESAWSGVPRWAAVAALLLTAGGGVGGVASAWSALQAQRQSTASITDQLDRLAAAQRAEAQRVSERLAGLAHQVEDVGGRVRTIERYVDREEAVRRLRESRE